MISLSCGCDDVDFDHDAPRLEVELKDTRKRLEDAICSLETQKNEFNGIKLSLKDKEERLEFAMNDNDKQSDEVLL